MDPQHQQGGGGAGGQQQHVANNRNAMAAAAAAAAAAGQYGMAGNPHMQMHPDMMQVRRFGFALYGYSAGFSVGPGSSSPEL